MQTLTGRRPSDTSSIRRITQRLVATYAGRYPQAHVEAVVATAAAQLTHARVRLYVPILVERIARDLLDHPQ